MTEEQAIHVFTDHNGHQIRTLVAFVLPIWWSSIDSWQPFNDTVLLTIPHDYRSTIQDCLFYTVLRTKVCLINKKGFEFYSVRQQSIWFPTLAKQILCFRLWWFHLPVYPQIVKRFLEMKASQSNFWLLIRAQEDLFALFTVKYNWV